MNSCPGRDGEEGGKSAGTLQQNTAHSMAGLRASHLGLPLVGSVAQVRMSNRRSRGMATGQIRLSQMEDTRVPSKKTDSQERQIQRREVTCVKRATVGVWAVIIVAGPGSLDAAVQKRGLLTRFPEKANFARSIFSTPFVGVRQMDLSQAGNSLGRLLVLTPIAGRLDGASRSGRLILCLSRSFDCAK